MIISPGEAFAIASAVVSALIGAVVSFIRTQGRLSAHEQVDDQRQMRADERHETIIFLLSDLRATVKAMDEKIQRLTDRR